MMMRVLQGLVAAGGLGLAGVADEASARPNILFAFAA